ncbi:protein Mis18-alpha [Thunnus thynnus]|uniref:protein Mis18-alpha n=1 Tax=Thunnus maccoyii TaxID=8240 RepID=UPI001C4C0364|nr:protein Mis18-alpha [Thunnus maccoyii]
MASREKLVKRPQKHVDSTFDLYSTDSTAVEEKLFGQAEEDEDSRTADDGPVVFICGKCKLPVGDSMSWDGSEDDQNQIRLKRVTDNVLVGKDTRLHEPSKRSLCLIVDLICRGCHSLLGMVYASTPKSMDHKRFTFCFNVADIDSYVLGSASQMLAAEGPKEQPVTLEYRGIVEQQLTEMKMLVVSMAQRLEEIEAGLQEGCDEV